MISALSRSLNKGITSLVVQPPSAPWVAACRPLLPLSRRQSLGSAHTARLITCEASAVQDTAVVTMSEPQYPPPGGEQGGDKKRRKRSGQRGGGAGGRGGGRSAANDADGDVAMYDAGYEAGAGAYQAAPQQAFRQQQGGRGGGGGGRRGGGRGGGGGRSFMQYEGQQQQQQQQQQSYQQAPQQRMQEPQQQTWQQRQHLPQQNGNGNSRRPAPQQQQQQAYSQQAPQQAPQQQQQQRQQAPVQQSQQPHIASHSDQRHATAGTQHAHAVDPTFLSDRSFSDPAIARLLSPATKAALKDVFGFDRMTKVQEATLEPLLAGKDCLAKAKTGGGKTLAFLVPTIERLSGLRRAGAGSQQGRQLWIGALVVSPARELALQILSEAERLLSTHDGGRAISVIGGRSSSKEAKQMTGRIDVLVGTPGRLVDHIENTEGFAQALSRVHVLILDEGDNLLDMGFKPQLDKIVAQLRPNTMAQGQQGAVDGPRQSLLVSATMPSTVASMAGRVLRKGHAIVDTSGGDDEDQLNSQVSQEALVVPAASVVPALARVLGRFAASNPGGHKAIVFFPTARQTGFMAGLFAKMGFNVLEVHSRRSQKQRDMASAAFRDGNGVCLFSSDVSARGMDYPNVGLVVQVGMTTREQYIHRLGRTARAGAQGAGLLILADYEGRPMLNKELQDLAIPLAGPNSPLTGGAANGLAGGAGQANAAVAIMPELARALAAVKSDKELLDEAEKSYRAWLGFYNGSLRVLGWDKARLVAEGNALFLTMGLTEVPTIEAKTVGKMGLKGTPGLRIERSAPGGGGGGGGRGGGGYGGGGGGRGGGGGGGRRF